MAASIDSPGNAEKASATGLANLSPLEQLRAGRMPRRLVQLFVGLCLFGASLALILRGSLGVEPWGVFHLGIMKLLPLSYGTVSIVVSLLVLLAWIPLRQWPGLGTIANAVVVGLMIDATLAVVPEVSGWVVRIGLVIAGIVLNGLACALYIGSQLGPGPRDGLMTGLSQRTGLSIRVVRTAIEVAVLVVGIVLGGQFGVGTVLYALAIGPVVQVFLPRCIVALPGHPSAAVMAGDPNPVHP